MLDGPSEGYNSDGVLVPGTDGGDVDVRVECQVCGRMIGKGPEGLGIKRHSKTHRQEFARRRGREPDSYAEVRDALDDRETEQARFAAFERDDASAGGG